MEETINNNNNNITVSAGSPPPPQAIVTNSLPKVMNMNVGSSTSGGIVTNIPAVALLQATTTTTPGNSGGGGGEGGFDLFGKKKRGRPRKYDSEGNLRSTYKTATSQPQQQGFTFSTSKKTPAGGTGRPTAFGNYQLLASYGLSLSHYLPFCSLLLTRQIQIFLLLLSSRE